MQYRDMKNYCQLQTGSQLRCVAISYITIILYIP
jgi:hypothetical protein